MCEKEHQQGEPRSDVGTDAPVSGSKEFVESAHWQHKIGASHRYIHSK